MGMEEPIWPGVPGPDPDSTGSDGPHGRLAAGCARRSGVGCSRRQQRQRTGRSPRQLVDLQLLAFNDYHGHVKPDDAGNIGEEPAGGGQYLATKLKELRAGNKYSLTVAAGDLIGGSPFFSGLFHDEPSVESLNSMGLDVSSVGNHEFDEGVTELLRMQDGGCHPKDGCYFPNDPYAGADFQWLAANVVDESGDTPLPPYWIKKFQNIKVGFIGMTLDTTDTLVAAAGIVGCDFLDEVETANAVVPELQAQGVEAIIVLLHEGGIPIPIEVNGCSGIYRLRSSPSTQGSIRLSTR